MNPYHITGPALISFSGGRTSAYMLHQILEAHQGKLPDDVQVTFANTGKERVETLDFIQECSNQWGVTVHWLEYNPDGGRLRKFTEVDCETASRQGEPFRKLIQKAGYIPNPVTRICTKGLKLHVLRDYALSLGWQRWQSVIGLRADEMHRVEKTSENAKKERYTPVCPMADAGATVDTVMGFWQQQPFDLKLKSHEGNCDLCFLKGAGKISRIMRDMPDLAQWWIDQEATALASKPDGGKFRNDRPSYAEMLRAVQMQQEFDFGIFDDLESCGSNMCTS